MTDCVIYPLFSGDAAAIMRMQYESLQQHAPTCRIIALEDGLYPCKVPLSVAHLTITVADGQHSSGFRAGPIAETLFRTIVPHQQERYAIFLHGDMLAISAITVESLFRGKTYVIAARKYHTDGTPHWANQILGLDTSKSLIPQWWKWNHRYAAIYPVKREFFSDRQHIEWIGPFKHLTAMGVNLHDRNPNKQQMPVKGQKKSKRLKKKCGGCTKKLKRRPKLS